MVEELGFTSTPQGLDPTASGYCTVFRTSGVSKTLQFELEALSVYRPHFPPGSPQEAQNPSNYSHQIVAEGRRRWHVVSRTAYAGTDYTGRNNHFSHHVLLGSEERPVNGPAWLASREGFLERTWDGRVEVLAGARGLPFDDGLGQAGVCREWENTVGDAGWAGRLVEMYLEAPSLPCYLIYRAGQAMLPLIKEALALLPPEQRWNVTFCTYYTSGGKSDYLWRGVLEGTPEAEQALRSSDRSRVFDLRSSRLGPAPASEWSEYARTGRSPAFATSAADNAGYAARGNGGSRSATVLVPKRRSSAPVEEFALSAPAVESAPALVPSTALASAPPPPPPAPAKSLTMPLIVAFVVGLPVAMLFSGALAWNMARKSESKTDTRSADQLRGELAQAAQMELGKKQREIVTLQEELRKEEKAHTETKTDLGEKIAAANKLAGSEKEAKEKVEAELKAVKETKKDTPQAAVLASTPTDDAAHEPVEEDGLIPAGVTARLLVGQAYAEGPGKPVYFLDGSEDRIFAARPEPRAVLFPSFGMQIVRPSNANGPWQILDNHKKDSGTLTRDAEKVNRWQYMPASGNGDETAALKWLAIEFDDKIVCLKEKPNSGTFTDEKPRSDEKSLRDQRTIQYAIKLSALKKGESPVDVKTLVPSDLRIDIEPSVEHFLPRETEWLLGVQLSGGVAAQVPRAGWTLTRDGELWKIALPVAQKAMHAFQTSKLAAITLAYRVLRSAPGGKGDSDAYYLPVGTWSAVEPAQAAPAAEQSVDKDAETTNRRETKDQKTAVP